MKRKNLLFFVCLIIIILSILFIFGCDYFMSNESNKKQQEKEIDLNSYNEDIIIKEPGVYVLKGKLYNSIMIEADDEVTLKLNGVTIESDNTAAIANKGSNDLIIELLDGTVNNLSDDGKSEYDGALYSMGNLFIEGKGTLIINGNQKKGEGISTTDSDITINGGIIYIESKDDGINAGGDAGGVITINDGIVNILSKGDGIDSNDNIIINGGIVYTISSAKDGDSGIDTVNGYNINGGTVIALASDMLELPASKSTQNVICFELDEFVDKENLITLMRDDEVIISFVAQERFKTLILSSKDLTLGNYYLYQGGMNNGSLEHNVYTNHNYIKGEKIYISNTDSFDIESNVSVIR